MRNCFVSLSVFSFLILLVLSGCTYKGSEEVRTENLSQKLAVEQQLRTLESRCPEVHDAAITRMLTQIKTRILSTSSLRERIDTIRFAVLSCREPFSYVLSPQLIVVSTGMLRAMPSEAALAFLLAHEFSHILLEHLEQGSSTRVSYRQEEEADADKQALYLLIAAHYHPWAALKVFQQPGIFSHSTQAVQTHPDIQKRLHMVKSLLLAAEWTPPGTISTRTFRKMQISPSLH